MPKKSKTQRGMMDKRPREIRTIDFLFFPRVEKKYSIRLIGGEKVNRTAHTKFQKYGSIDWRTDQRPPITMNKPINVRLNLVTFFVLKR